MIIDFKLFRIQAILRGFPINFLKCRFPLVNLRKNFILRGDIFNFLKIILQSSFQCNGYLQLRKCNIYNL